jgi:hypothetical protein
MFYAEQQGHSDLKILHRMYVPVLGMALSKKTREGREIAITSISAAMSLYL